MRKAPLAYCPCAHAAMPLGELETRIPQSHPLHAPCIAQKSKRAPIQGPLAAARTLRGAHPKPPSDIAARSSAPCGTLSRRAAPDRPRSPP